MNSLLSELALPTHETWLLPHSETLCVIRYLEESHGIATPNGQGGKDTSMNIKKKSYFQRYRHRPTDRARMSDP